MGFLLKIVEGPMRGAEIALVEGLRVSVGSGDDCDIVLADGSLPAHAFELDVTATTVTLVKGDETQALTPYEIVDVGTTAFAVGPAEGEWPENLARAKGLAAGATGARSGQPADGATGVKPGRPADGATGARSGQPADGATGAKPGRPADGATGAKPDAAGANSGAAGARLGVKGSASVASAAGASPAEAEASGNASERRRRGCLFAALAFFILLILLAGLLFFFWPRVRAACPAAETARVAVVEQSRRAWGWAKGLCRGIRARCAKPAPAVVLGPSLAEIAAQHGLALGERNGAPLLAGNLRRRTERLAIRSLALADSPNVRFDLTDDESLKAAADELLFVVTEGALKAVAASNRVVTLTGRIPTSAALEKAVRALNADVKGIARLVTDGVSVGGPLPTATADEPATAPKRRVAKPSAPDYPIAGILTAPYPCVVLRNGTRLTEGASLGTAVLVTIAADKLTLKDGGTTFEWRP